LQLNGKVEGRVGVTASSSGAEVARCHRARKSPGEPAKGIARGGVGERVEGNRITIAGVNCISPWLHRDSVCSADCETSIVIISRQRRSGRAERGRRGVGGGGGAGRERDRDSWQRGDESEERRESESRVRVVARASRRYLIHVKARPMAGGGGGGRERSEGATDRSGSLDERVRRASSWLSSRT